MSSPTAAAGWLYVHQDPQTANAPPEPTTGQRGASSSSELAGWEVWPTAYAKWAWVAHHDGDHAFGIEATARDAFTNAHNALTALQQ